MVKKLLFFLLSVIPLLAITQPQKDFLSSQNQNHTYPLTDVSGTNRKLTIRDTFYIYNRYREAIHIKNVLTQNGGKADIAKKLPSLKETPLYFEVTIYNNGEDFRHFNYTIGLELEDNSYFFCGVSVPAVGNNTRVFYKADGLIDYTIAQQPDTRFTTAIFTFPDGHIRARGMVQDMDTTKKMGKWEYYTQGRWQLDTIAHTKELMVSAWNQLNNYDGTKFPFRLKLRENGVWKEPIMEERAAGKRFFYPPATDSVVAYTDSLSYGFGVSFKDMPTTSNRQFYLLKPGERTLKVGLYRVPFGTMDDTYALIIYPEGNITPKRTYQFVEDSFYTALHKQFPKLAQVVINKHQRGIYTGSLTNNEKQNLMTWLQKNRMVNYICQIYTTTHEKRQAYCNNRVYVHINGYKTDELKKYALDLGFMFSGVDGFSSNNYWFTYKSRLIDEEFFAAYKKLTEHPVVNAVYPSNYGYAEPDDGNPGMRGKE